MESLLHDISWVVPYRSDTATVIFNALTELGYLNFFLVFLPLGYWLWDKDLFTRLAVLIMVTAIVNAFLKDFFQDPRPPIELAVDPRTAGSFGLPSGHAQVAVAMWLWLAIEVRRWWMWVLCIFIAVGVCASRIYLGVHDVEDVAVGALLGLLSLGIFRIFVSDLFKRWHDLPAMVQIGVLLSVMPVLFLVWPLPAGPGSSAAIVAFLAGWWAGVLYDRRRVAFKRHPNWIVALVGAAFGIVFLLGIAKPGETFLTDAGLAKVWAQTLLFGFMALFVTLIAPWVFRQLRMAHKA